MNLKKFLPNEDYILITNLSIDEVRKRISDNIESKKVIRFRLFNKKFTKPFEGELIDNSFTIRSLMSGRNSFLPIINGNISASLEKTQVHIKMRLHYVVLIGTLLWIGFVGYGCIKNLVTGYLRSKDIVETVFSANVILPFTMFAFGCVLMFLPFTAESKKSKDILSEILEGYEYNL